MSIRSKREILNEAASAVDATEIDIFRAALNESQEKYNELSAKLIMGYDKLASDFEALEAAVRRSNSQKAMDVQEALKTALEAILEDMRGKVAAYVAEVEAATAKLQAAKKEKEKNDTWEGIKAMGIAFVVIVAAFYVALLLYGWWYDIPEAVRAVGKLDAINNGIYQLLQR